MKKVQIFIFLLFCCLTQIAWVWQNPKDQEFMKKAYEEYSAGNYNAAISDYEGALAIKPRNTDALNFLGVIYERLGYPDKAQEKYLAAISINRRYLPAYLNLGLLYWNQGDLEKAKYYFQKRIALGQPKDVWTLKAKAALAAINAKSNVPAFSDDLSKKETIKIEHERTPQSVMQSKKIENKIKVTSNQDRIKAINQALDSVGKLGDSAEQTVVNVQVMPMPPDAQENVVVESKEQQAQALFSQGQQLASSGQYQEAIAIYDRVLKITPGDPQVIRARVDVFLQWKQKATADL